MMRLEDLSKEDFHLLLEDLSSRLPYGVMEALSDIVKIPLHRQSLN